MIDKGIHEEIVREVEELFELHEKTLSDSAKCREFNSRACIFLSKLEEMGCNQLADRLMDLLGSCSPKDFSHCDNNLQTRSALERLKEKVRELQ